MRLRRLITIASAAGLIVWPALAAAQPGTAPATTPAPATAPAAPPAPALPSIPKITGGANIYQTLKDSGQFTILVKALDSAGLAPYLTGYPNFTFFAPTDAAFNALPADMLTKLLAQNDTAANQLQQILKYYLITVPVDSSKIRGAKGPIPTVEGKSVMVDGSNPDDLKIDDADIIQTDIHTANGGFIHVLDKVIIPSDSPYYSAPAAPPAPATPPATPSPGAATP
jgi:uncharacterized surface protein with fasciclin (FAS1) repeats